MLRRYLYSKNKTEERAAGAADKYNMVSHFSIYPLWPLSSHLPLTSYSQIVLLICLMQQHVVATCNLANPNLKATGN